MNLTLRKRGALSNFAPNLAEHCLLSNGNNSICCWNPGTDDEQELSFQNHIAIYDIIGPRWVPNKGFMLFTRTKMDEKSQISEKFDSMYAFDQHDGKIDYDTGKFSPPPSEEAGDIIKVFHTSAKAGEDSSEYEKYAYPSLLLEYENTSTQYWHNLDEQSKATLTKLQEWIQKESIQVDILAANELHSSLLLLRFLRAYKFDLAKTKTHLSHYMRQFFLVKNISFAR